MKANILIVEDDPMVQFIHRSYLERLAVFERIFSVETVEEAQEMLQKETIELLLLDIHLKDGNGLELLQTLREQQQAVDVIMITAADETRLISQSLHLGMLDYLIKPFSFERFAQSIQVFQQRRESLKHPRIAQQQIDLLLQGNQKSPWIELEKRLTEDTLQLIQETIRTIKQPFTVQELAQACALSHVSVRKYVAHLEKTKAIRSENVYTKIGRPYKQYFLTYAEKQTTD